MGQLEHQIFIETPRDPKGKLAWLSMNQRLHWAPKAERTKQWRTLARFAAGQAKLPTGLDGVNIMVHVHKTHNRSYDAHNYLPTAKAVVDGLVDYKLIEDDDNSRLTGPDMRPGEKRDVAGITVTIRPSSTYDVIRDE